jgi:hypothetical protein
MRRREFLKLAGAGCLTISPVLARAQRAVPAKVCFLGGSSSTVGQTLLSCFLSELRNLALQLPFFEMCALSDSLVSSTPE